MTRQLKGEFDYHEVHTVEEAGFRGLENGELLRGAVGIYDVLITVDRNIQYQQNLKELSIAIVVLAAKRNTYLRLKPLIPKALTALETIESGAVVRIEG